MLNANARLSWKKELTPGVPDFPPVPGGLSTTLAEPASPGATSIEVASATGVTSGDIIRVGDDDNPEYVEVASVSGTTISLSADTPIYFHHVAGEKVEEVQVGGFKQVSAYVSSDALATIDSIVSPEIRAHRGTPESRGGNVNVSFSLSVVLETEQSGVFFRYALGKDYATAGTAVSGGGSTTLSSSASKGDATISVGDTTGFATGDFCQIGSGAVSEVHKISSVDSMAGTITLEEGLRFSHASGEQVVEVQGPFTSTFKRGADLDSITILLHHTDSDKLYLVKGAKINTLETTYGPGNDVVTLNMGIIAQSYQLLKKNIFGTPQTFEAVFYAPWENKIKKDGSYINIVEEFTWRIDNQIPADGGRSIGSRFRTRVIPGRGVCGGSFNYAFTDVSFIEDVILGRTVDLESIFTYSEDTNHKLSVRFPRAKIFGGLSAPVGGDGPISDSKSFNAEFDSAENTDVVIEVTSPEYLFE